MTTPLYRTLTGAVNGVNATFSFGEPFQPSTSVVLVNGQVILHSAGNPWSENPGAGTITFEPGREPLPGDTVAGFALGVDDDSEPYITRPEATIGAVERTQVECVLEPRSMLTLQLLRIEVDLAIEPRDEVLLHAPEREVAEVINEI